MKNLLFTTLFFVSLFNLAYADVAEQVTIKSFSKSKNQLFVTANSLLPFVDGEILNVESDCALTVQKVSPGAIILKSDLCQNSSQLAVGNKLYLVRKDFGGASAAYPAVSSSSTQVMSNQDFQIPKKHFYVGLIKAFDAVKVSNSYYSGRSSDAEQVIGFSFQYQNINPYAGGFLAGLSHNQYKYESNVTRLFGAGTYGFNDIVYANGGLSLTNIKPANAPVGTGIGFLFGVGGRINNFSASLGYNYSKATLGGSYDSIDVEVSGVELAAGVIF